jgi:hypothetical protein
MTYHDKIQLTIIIVALPIKWRRATASFGATRLGWRLRTTGPGRRLF